MKLFRGRRALWALFDQAILSMGHFLAGLFLARYLEKKQFGTYILCFAIVAALRNIQNSLVSIPMSVLGVSTKPENTRRYFSHTYISQWVLSIVLAGLLAVAFVFLAKEGLEISLRRSLLGVLIALIPMLGQEHMRRVLLTMHRTNSAFWNDTLTYSIQVGLVVLFHSKGLLDEMTVFYAFALGSGAGYVLGFVQCRKVMWTSLRGMSITVRRNWHFGRWILVEQIALTTSVYIYPYLVAIVLDRSAAGSLVACQQLMGPLHVMYLALTTYGTTVATTQLKRKGQEGLRRMLRVIAFVGAALVFIYICTILVLGKSLMSFIYMGKHVEVAYLLKPLGAVYFLSFFCKPLILFFRAIEQPKRVTIAGWIQVCVVVTFVPLLTIQFGLIGAVLGMMSGVIANLIALFLGYFHATKRKNRRKVIESVSSATKQAL